MNDTINQIKEICENSIQSSKMDFLDDYIHKIGLIASMEEIMELCEIHSEKAKPEG